MKQEKEKKDKGIVTLKNGKRLGLVLLSGIVGGALGASFDRFSLPLGLISVGYGATRKIGKNETENYKAIAGVSSGIAMIVGQGNTEETQQQEETVEGLAGVVGDPKSKAVNFLKAMGKKAMLDKVPVLKDKISLDGLGNTPNENIFLGKSFAEAEADVDNIIAEIEASNVEGEMEGIDSQELLNGADAHKLLNGVDANKLMVA